MVDWLAVPQECDSETESEFGGGEIGVGAILSLCGTMQGAGGNDTL